MMAIKYKGLLSHEIKDLEVDDKNEKVLIIYLMNKHFTYYANGGNEACNLSHIITEETKNSIDLEFLDKWTNMILSSVVSLLFTMNENGRSIETFKKISDILEDKE